MKLRKFQVVGLNKRVDIDCELHDDVNILTGVNGSGKTSALKLMWYLVSGNCIRLRNEITFRECFLATDLFTVGLKRTASGDIEYRFSRYGEEPESTGLFSDTEYDSDGDPFSDGEDLLRDMIRSVSPSSLYFPTFRRIEGGYSISPARRWLSSGARSISVPQADAGLSDEMQQLSQRLSSGGHRFVCSISTEDIAALLTERYAQVSGDVNRAYTEFSGSILEKIRNWEHGNATETSDALLLEIQTKARDVEMLRDSSLRPMSVLSSLVVRMFSFQGIKLRNHMLGDAAAAIDSNVLSAGEKQMLSFLVYNAFFLDSPIFIDEPELSLHPDWQRGLFPALLEQQATNQFIVSTHSPFIYSKYSDKEIQVNIDRGD